MPKDFPITTEKFDKLLDWLDKDRSLAAVRYESIRMRLIRLFSCRGCFDSEDLADETINRVIRRIDELANSIQGNPVSYFYGVASNIYLEWLRDRRRFTELPPDTARKENETDDDGEHACLDTCLEELAIDDRALILDYYQGEISEKIQNRRQIAARMKISSNALQVKVLRLRTGIKRCLDDCMVKSGV